LFTHRLTVGWPMLQSPGFDLVRLLDPVRPETFLRDHWEERPLHVARLTPGYYDALLTLAQIDPLVSVFPTHNVTVANADAALAVGDYARGEAAAGTLALDVVKAWQLFAQGATIIIREAHKQLEALAGLCRRLERDLGAPCQVNLYLTPPGGQGFETHYDTHDVLVLQIAGAKAWTIFDPPIRLPLAGQPHDERVHTVGAPIMTCALEAGDLLYLPRGFAHQGRSGNQISLHATIGILSYRWSDVLVEAVAQACLADPELRRTLPVTLGRPDFDVAAARQTFDRLMARVRDQVQPDAVLTRLADAFAVGRPAFVPGQLAQIAAAQTLALDDTVGVRPDAIFRLAGDGEMLRLRAHGRETQIVADAANAVAYALQTARYRVRDLPGTLDDDDKLTLIRRLMEEGLVVRHAAP
jgi:ribosomal protein L16 Arg81 hydroxylase